MHIWKYKHIFLTYDEIKCTYVYFLYKLIEGKKSLYIFILSQSLVQSLTHYWGQVNIYWIELLKEETYIPFQKRVQSFLAPGITFTWYICFKNSYDSSICLAYPSLLDGLGI